MHVPIELDRFLMGTDVREQQTGQYAVQVVDWTSRQWAIREPLNAIGSVN